MIFEKGSKVLIIGDSITDACRERPVGLGEGLGLGYVKYINAIIQTEYPELGITIMNTGIGGDTIRNLKARWQTDVIDLAPDYLAIHIGVNDVWRSFDSPDHPELAVELDEYIATYNELLDQTKPKVKAIILMTPFLSETDKSEPMFAKLLGYIQAVKDIAEKHGLTCVDMQAEFESYMARGLSPAMLSGDRVHPSQVGAMVMAKAFMKAVNK